MNACQDANNANMQNANPKLEQHCRWHQPITAPHSRQARRFHTLTKLVWAPLCISRLGIDEAIHISRIKVQAFAFCKAARQCCSLYTSYTALLWCLCPASTLLAIRECRPLPLVSAESRNMSAGPVIVPPRCGMCGWSESSLPCAPWPYHLPTWSSPQSAPHPHPHPHPGKDQAPPPPART